MYHASIDYGEFKLVLGKFFTINVFYKSGFDFSINPLFEVKKKDFFTKKKLVFAQLNANGFKTTKIYPYFVPRCAQMFKKRVQLF